jgi:hypothetical protein
MHYWDKLATYEREGYTIVLDKTWEDLSPRDCFDDSVTDLDKMCRDIDSGYLDWFMLRVRVFVEDLEIARTTLGGNLYENAHDILTDGCAEDMIYEALAEAKGRVYSLSRTFTELSYAVDAEGVLA